VETAAHATVNGALWIDAMSDFSGSRFSKYIAVFVGGVLVGGAILAIVLRSRMPLAPDNLIDMSNHGDMMGKCTERVFGTIAAAKVTPGLYDRVWKLCGNQIFNGLYLDDFIIRRRKFIDQEFDERVNLWLVVTITMSGVFMSAVQLFLSYRLATTGKDLFTKDSELAIESGKVSLKSSVAGLLILTLSLAFFMIYVLYIYSIKEIPLERPQNLQTQIETESPDPAPQPTPAPVELNPPAPH
jgi:hypothetical protein